MNKSEYEPYLRKLVLRDKLAVTTNTNPEAGEELDEMEKPPNTNKEEDPAP